MPFSAPLTTIVTGTLAGGPGRNQDHVVVGDSVVALLDGATSWLPQAPARDGGWYARTLGASLTTRLEDSDRTVAQILADAITEVRDRYDLTAGDAPSSTVTIARWSQDAIEIYALGDSPAVIYPRQGEAILVRDERLDEVATGYRTAYLEHLKAGYGFNDRLAALMSELQTAERPQRNRPGGYWIAESDPAAASHAVTATFPRNEVLAVLLASDGVSADVMDYHRNDWPDVYEFLTQASPPTYLRNIHAAEEADVDGRWWPRAKRHDDKTLAWIGLD